MENVLYTDEHIVQTDDLLNDRFIVTNKRLIYNDVIHIKPNASTGLNTISGVDYKRVTFDVYKFTDKEIGAWIKRVIFLTGLPCVIYVIIYCHFTDFAAIMLAGILMLGAYCLTIGIVVGIITNYILVKHNQRTATTTDRIELTITKTDHTIFFNRIYPVDKLDNIKSFAFQLNDKLYQRVTNIQQ